jgi:glycosyltransferase involved in cell wall biosynthesis
MPANSGDALRNLALLRAARSIATRLDLVTLPQSPGNGVDDGLGAVEDLCDSVTVAGRPIGEQLGSPVARVRTLLGRPYYHAVGHDPGIRAAVRGRLSTQRYDVVVLAQLYLAAALPPEVLPRTVYDTHNVHHLRLRESLAAVTVLPTPVRERIIRQVCDQEARLLDRVALGVACSELDAAGFAAMSPAARVEVVANGIDVPPSTCWTGAGRRPLFLASLDASANIEGLAYLVDEVIPHLPVEIGIDVAGSNARPAVSTILGRAGGRVRYLGQVPDARRVMSGAGALLVPLLTGGGTRLKVLEAFAVGVPVVGTSKGVEGIGVEAGVHARVADTAPGFAAAIVSILQDPAAAARLARSARELVEQRFDWGSLAPRFARLLTEAAADGVGRASDPTPSRS